MAISDKIEQLGGILDQLNEVVVEKGGEPSTTGYSGLVSAVENLPEGGGGQEVEFWDTVFGNYALGFDYNIRENMSYTDVQIVYEDSTPSISMSFSGVSMIAQPYQQDVQIVGSGMGGMATSLIDGVSLLISEDGQEVPNNLNLQVVYEGGVWRFLTYTGEGLWTCEITGEITDRFEWYQWTQSGQKQFWFQVDENVPQTQNQWDFPDGSHSDTYVTIMCDPNDSGVRTQDLSISNFCEHVWSQLSGSGERRLVIPPEEEWDSTKMIPTTSVLGIFISDRVLDEDLPSLDGIDYFLYLFRKLHVFYGLERILQHDPNGTRLGHDFMGVCESFSQPLSLEGVTYIGYGFLSYCISFNEPIYIPEGVEFGVENRYGLYKYLNFMVGCPQMTSQIIIDSPPSDETLYEEDNTFMSFYASAAYKYGIPVQGLYSSEWKTKFPDVATTSPNTKYRKLI